MDSQTSPERLPDHVLKAVLPANRDYLGTLYAGWDMGAKPARRASMVVCGKAGRKNLFYSERPGEEIIPDPQPGEYVLVKVEDWRRQANTTDYGPGILHFQNKNDLSVLMIYGGDDECLTVTNGGLRIENDNMRWLLGYVNSQISGCGNPIELLITERKTKIMDLLWGKQARPRVLPPS